MANANTFHRLVFISERAHSRSEHERMQKKKLALSRSWWNQKKKSQIVFATLVWFSFYAAVHWAWHTTDSHNLTTNIRISGLLNIRFVIDQFFVFLEYMVFLNKNYPEFMKCLSLLSLYFFLRKCGIAQNEYQSTFLNSNEELSGNHEFLLHKLKYVRNSMLIRLNQMVLFFS